MTLLDIDLDAFVSPAVCGREVGAPRPLDSDHEIPTLDEVRAIALEKWKIRQNTPITLLEQHHTIIAKVEARLSIGDLIIPLRWFHVDAHDDFSGHSDGRLNPGNFMFEVVRRGWCSQLTWIVRDGCFIDGPPINLVRDSLNRVAFGNYSVPWGEEMMDRFNLSEPPDWVFLCRSPEFTPPKADSIYQLIAGLGAVRP